MIETPQTGTHVVVDSYRLGLEDTQAGDLVEVISIDQVTNGVTLKVSGDRVVYRPSDIYFACLEPYEEQPVNADTKPEKIARVKIVTPVSTYYSAKYYDDEIYDELYPFLMGEDFQGNQLPVIDIALEDGVSSLVLDKSMTGHVDFVIEYLKGK